MSERSELIASIRGEVVGPSRPLRAPAIAVFQGRDFFDPIPLRRGPLGWLPTEDDLTEEILYYDRETPYRKYGAGLLYPAGAPLSATELAAETTDTRGVDVDESEEENPVAADDDEAPGVTESADGDDTSDDFEVTSADIVHPSTIGITFCVNLESNGSINIRLPRNRRFAWQDDDSPPFSLNGRYEHSIRRWNDDEGQPKEAQMWRRRPAVLDNTRIVINCNELVAGKPIFRDVAMPEGSPISLRVEVFPRQIANRLNIWLVTVVLHNRSSVEWRGDPRESVLYQTYFEVSVSSGGFEKYPESQRPLSQLDEEEQSLALLYYDSATWAIGHGCAAGWDSEPDQTPNLIYADVLPAVQTPSMTPDIVDDQGNPIRLSMRSLAALPDNPEGPAWQSLEDLAQEYSRWIRGRRNMVSGLPANLQGAAGRHLDACDICLDRINTGIAALRTDRRVRIAFRLANLSMLLQQIASKQLSKRSLQWYASNRIVLPEGDYRSPWAVYEQESEASDIGLWRAFQVAFLLMSIDGISNVNSPDREIVDLIWFPTGGGKTEAYLAVMAFYMFHERLLMKDSGTSPSRDGTNVLMRYTLRMLTTQQFQRAASLVCAMEFLRRNPQQHGFDDIPGKRFSLGLWIGSSASPNNVEQARGEVNSFRAGKIEGNPLVLAECPWCRAEIGRYEGKRPSNIQQSQWNALRTRGISDVNTEGPLLHCTDSRCAFGAEEWETWIPVEVIDERIYKYPPSLVIATADKFAMIAYRPTSGSIFGHAVVNDEILQTHVPPGLIIQDELHLISGPLGTMYALYEGIFERLCSQRISNRWTKPKLIASTATIRGAAEQTLSLYARNQVQLFPSPGLTMGDSYFGRYARDEKNHRLLPGRLYLGIHANNYGSVLTAQVRAFSSALFRPYAFAADRRDPWWTLLAFYNSIRELGGAKTLFDSDIRSRLKFLFNREDFGRDDRRRLKPSEELTSRLSQSEIVAMLDRLSTPYDVNIAKVVDACLASSIIEVGVDIERLSLMGIVGQPKTTAQYIQVTGRVGRRWWERPGLILMIYNPSKSRDRSHFEQFHSYHRRLYERVEPTSATPFALSAIQRALPGALIAWARQHATAPVQSFPVYENKVDEAYELLLERCQTVLQGTGDQTRSLQELARVRDKLKTKWRLNPQKWEEFPPNVNGEYLMLWPGQYATLIQKQRGTTIASSMRQVDGSAELSISQGYAFTNVQGRGSKGGQP